MGRGRSPGVTCGEDSHVYGPAGAGRADQLVFCELGAQHGQIKDLAAFDNCVLQLCAVADAALRAVGVPDEHVRLSALHQGVSAMARLAAVGILAWGVQ